MSLDGRRASTPTFLQMEAVESGAAALGSVLAAHGRWEPLEALRIACGVSRDGSTPANIINAAKRYGLEAKGLRRETAQLRELRMPAILHWDFNHFLVLEGFKGDTVFLNDPARGPRRVSYEELDSSFTGVVLTFEPTDELVTGGSRFRASRSLLARLAGSFGALAFAILAGLLLIVPGVVLAVLVQVFIDDVLVAGRTHWMAAIVFGLGAVAISQFWLTWLQGTALLRLETKLALVSTSSFLWHVMRLPMRFFEQRQPGDIGRRIALNSQLAQLLTSQGALAAVNALAAFFYLVIMIRYDWQLTLIAAALAVTNAALVRYVYERNSVASQRILGEQAKLQGAAVAGLFNIETLKATGRESDFFAKWAGHHARALNAQRDHALRAVVLNAVPTLLSALSTAAILVIGGLEVIDGALTLGELFGFQTLMASFTAPVQAAVNFSTQLQQAESYMKRLDDVLDYEHAPHVGDVAGPDDADRLEGALELRDITFGYSPLVPPLIEGFSLRLEPAARVALVGGTGSGKSTIAKLVVGLYEPWEGDVLFDDRPLKEIGARRLSDSLALVDQETLLFEGTVTDNLALWDPTIGPERLVAAATDACIHDDIARRPGGYHAHVDEDGRNFSGGQRQRLEIARALVGDPRILVLDEATSALDPLTEQRIDQALRRRGSTCLIIAHRLSTIRDCDEIVVLERGRVVERGTHEELIERAGVYATLVRTEG